MIKKTKLQDEKIIEVNDEICTLDITLDRLKELLAWEEEKGKPSVDYSILSSNYDGAVGARAVKGREHVAKLVSFLSHCYPRFGDRVTAELIAVWSVALGDYLTTMNSSAEAVFSGEADLNSTQLACAIQQLPAAIRILNDASGTLVWVVEVEATILL